MTYSPMPQAPLPHTPPPSSKKSGIPAWLIVLVVIGLALVLGGGTFALVGSLRSDADHSSDETVAVSTPTASADAQSSPVPDAHKSEPPSQPSTQTPDSSSGDSSPSPSAAGLNLHADGSAVEAQCGALNVTQAVTNNTHQLISCDANAQWYAVNTSTYDPCADVSWVVVETTHWSSPVYHIMIFHRGQYLGTATKLPYFHQPTTSRISDGTFEAIYYYGPSNDAWSSRTIGSATSHFTWDDTNRMIVHTGEFPPEYSTVGCD